MRGLYKVSWIGHLVALMMMSELVEAQRGTLLNTTDRVLGSAVSFFVRHCPKPERPWTRMFLDSDVP